MLIVQGNNQAVSKGGRNDCGDLRARTRAIEAMNKVVQRHIGKPMVKRPLPCEAPIAPGELCPVVAGGALCDALLHRVSPLWYSFINMMIINNTETVLCQYGNTKNG